MADTADVKPKILSISELSEIVAQHKQMKEQAAQESERSGSMTRPSKLFIKVDSEGLLTDTIAISDVVDFSCYESIVSSACRIIACFQSTKPQNIEVEALFYYKKRARSTRMNPVQIRSTTDAFKAVAEHPIGEVPIGVRWSQRLKYRFTTNAGKTKIQRVPDTDDQPPRLQPVKIAPKPSPDDTENAVPEKKQKLEDQVIVVGPNPVQTDPKTLAQNATTHISPFTKINQAYPVISSEAFKGPNIVQKGLTAPENKPKPVSVTVIKGKHDDLDVEEGDEKPDPPILKYMPRQAPDPQYMFPKDARTEFVVTYGDGVIEKRKLPDDICRVVQMMLRGNYSYLTKEAQVSLGVGIHGSHLQAEEKRNQEDNYPTGTNKSGVIQFENDKPIRYIKDAKSEVFRILSMLSVSKARFKSLLKWMKTLKLEDGKKGKYFLSARDIIGGTKYVISSGFETDEQNMLKHDQGYRPYGSASADSASKGVATPAIPEPPHNQIMFLMPTSAIPSNTTPVFKTSTGMAMVPTSKVVHISPVPATSQATVTVASSSHQNTDTVSSFTNTPHILRKRPRKAAQPVKSRDSSPNPVPMNLFRAYQHSEDGLSLHTDSSEKDGNLGIKVEPHDYDSETSDATLDYDRHSERDAISPRPLHPDNFTLDASVFSDSVTNSYDERSVLRSDAAMPQSAEADKPFDIIIKSEPLDYE